MSKYLEKTLGLIGDSLKGFFTKNLGIKIIALVFSIILWGYVLTNENPYRTKTVTGFSITFEGETDLNTRGLCIQDREQSMPSMTTANLQTRIANYAGMDQSDVSAYVSLRSITSPGVYTLPIRISATGATVGSYYPESIEVVIDHLITKKVPVSIHYEGTVEEGYWADMNNATASSSIDIQGPRSVLNRIRRGECVVDLSGTSKTVNRYYGVSFYDENNEEITVEDIGGGLIPESYVRVPIYPSKIVPVSVESSIVGTENLSSNYYVTTQCSKAEVRIVGDQAAVSETDLIKVEPINISDVVGTQDFKVKLQIPDGIRLAEDVSEVTVSVTIREHTLDFTFEKIPIILEGRNDRLQYSLDHESADVFIYGKVSLVNNLARQDISILTDVSGLLPGEYDLPIIACAVDSETTAALQVDIKNGTAALQKVHVIITALPEETPVPTAVQPAEETGNAGQN